MGIGGMGFVICTLLVALAGGADHGIDPLIKLEVTAPSRVAPDCTDWLLPGDG